MPSLPSEDDLWKWLGDQNLTDDEAHEIDYVEREIIERKVYICMKTEAGADWLAGKFEEGLKFKGSEEQEVTIYGRKEGEQWLEVIVRGVFPNTEIKAVENVFRQFGDVKEVAFVTMGPKKVKFNKLTMKMKLEEGKSLPGFVLAPIGEGEMERWEVTSKGPGGSKVCLQCYQHGHIRKQCRNQPPTMEEVKGGRAGTAISYAAVLAGRSAPVVPPPQTPLQLTLATNAQTTARVSNASSMENPNPTLNAMGGTSMPVGSITGDPASNMLISSVATTTQALEFQTTVTNGQTTARASTASSMENLNPTLKAMGGTSMPVGSITGDPASNMLISSVATTTQALEFQTTVTNGQTTARASTASSMENLNPTLKAMGGTSMPVGSTTGEPASNMLISSVATTTQALELQTTVTKAQTIARASTASSMENLNPMLKATGGPTMPAGPITGESVAKSLMSSDAATTQARETTSADQMTKKQLDDEIKKLKGLVEEKKERNQEQQEKMARKEDKAGRKESPEKRSRETKRKNREDSSGERPRSTSEKRKREDRRRLSKEGREERKGHTSREGYPPHYGAQPWKSRTSSEPNTSHHNGSHK